MRLQRGFTLIELMIVVAVVAILAAIAIPNFLEQSRKGRRAEAARGVGELQMQMERWRADCPTYANLAACRDPDGNGTEDVPYPSTSGASSTDYGVTIPTADATTYTILASKRGKQANDRCGNLGATRNTKPVWTGDADCSN